MCRCLVDPNELPWVEVGQRGVVELSYLPDRRFEGMVTWIAPILDATTRTARVRLELENPEGRLKPEMFGNVRIESAPRPQVVAIPSEAVIRSGRRSLVIVARAEPSVLMCCLNRASEAQHDMPSIVPVAEMSP